jgi:hypothetical protein
MARRDASARGGSLLKLRPYPTTEIVVMCLGHSSVLSRLEPGCQRCPLAQLRFPPPLLTHGCRGRQVTPALHQAHRPTCRPQPSDQPGAYRVADTGRIDGFEPGIELSRPEIFTDLGFLNRLNHILLPSGLHPALSWREGWMRAKPPRPSDVMAA